MFKTQEGVELHEELCHGAVHNLVAVSMGSQILNQSGLPRIHQQMENQLGFEQDKRFIEDQLDRMDAACCA
jgi:hypothetical protein